MADIDEVLRFVETRLPEPLRNPVEFQVGMPALRSLCVPMALQQAASSTPGHITVHPSFFDLDTAAGIALIAHEMYHQMQFQQMPDLMQRYAVEQARVEREGLPPYANKFEYPAYLFEAQVYREALRMGYPPGNHKPLLIEVTEGSMAVQIDTPEALIISSALSAMAMIFVAWMTTRSRSRQAA